MTLPVDLVISIPARCCFLLLRFFLNRIQPLTYTTFGAVSKDARQWIDRVEQAAIAGAHYFPGLERRFKVVWRENISFALLRATAAAAMCGVQKHRAEMALVSPDN